MYMSPEVCRHLPYNEKTDVYSFGVMMFEVFSRHMLVMTADVALKVSPEEYAQMVAGGYRPPRPNKMDEELYALIEWCWRVSGMFTPVLLRGRLNLLLRMSIS